MANSWSGLRKRLEQDLLCEKLRGRVQYYLTHYHGAPDDYGRFAVRVDGEELIFAHPYNDMAVSCLSDQVKEELGEERDWWTLDEEDPERYEAIFRASDLQAIRNNTMEIYHITDAIRTYLNQPIGQSIRSENPAVRLFAVLDRRVGKRALRRLRDEVAVQPEWLRPIYRLRLAAEELL